MLQNNAMLSQDRHLLFFGLIVIIAQFLLLLVYRTEESFCDKLTDNAFQNFANTVEKERLQEKWTIFKCR